MEGSLGEGIQMVGTPEEDILMVDTLELEDNHHMEDKHLVEEDIDLGDSDHEKIALCHGHHACPFRLPFFFKLQLLAPKGEDNTH